MVALHPGMPRRAPGDAVAFLVDGLPRCEVGALLRLPEHELVRQLHTLPVSVSRRAMGVLVQDILSDAGRLPGHRLFDPAAYTEPDSYELRVRNRIDRLSQLVHDSVLGLRAPGPGSMLVRGGSWPPSTARLMPQPLLPGLQALARGMPRQSREEAVHRLVGVAALAAVHPTSASAADAAAALAPHLGMSATELLTVLASPARRSTPTALRSHLPGRLGGDAVLAREAATRFRDLARTTLGLPGAATPPTASARLRRAVATGRRGTERARR